jgi:hypothetical protein
LAIGHHQVAAADGARDQKGSRFDAVGIDAMLGAVQLVHALHPDGRGARALDIRAHGHQQSGQVDHLRLARAILHQRIALGKNSRHEQVFRAGHGDLVEDDMRAMQPFGARFQIAVLLHDGCAHRSSPLRCRSMGRSPMAQPPGWATRASPQRATNGPSTSEEARMVLTISYLAVGSESTRQLMVVRCCARP